MLRDALPKLGRVKRYTLMAVRIPTPMGREPQAAHQPREHGSTLNFASKCQQTLALGIVNLVYAAEDTVTWSPTELCANLGVIYRGQPALNHLQADVFPEEPTAHPYGPDDPFVLIPPVDVGPHVTAKYVGLEEVQRFGAKRLGFASEMRCFRGVYSGDADGDLSYLELAATPARPNSPWLDVVLGRHFPTPPAMALSLTVLPLSAFRSVGMLLSQLHPASRPPGVWNRWKLSPSPTLVTRPKRLLLRKKPGCM
ncbi:hypothetical protein PspLS_07412, partial [Pyricularia sp. CBS 133598]